MPDCIFHDWQRDIAIHVIYKNGLGLSTRDKAACDAEPCKSNQNFREHLHFPFVDYFADVGVVHFVTSDAGA